MSKIKWHSGPPPSVGWWPTKRTLVGEQLRWWDGLVWSVYCTQDDADGGVLNREARCKLFARQSKGVRWTDRPASWPKRSRT